MSASFGRWIAFFRFGRVTIEQQLHHSFTRQYVTRPCLIRDPLSHKIIASPHSRSPPAIHLAAQDGYRRYESVSPWIERRKELFVITSNGIESVLLSEDITVVDCGPFTHHERPRTFVEGSKRVLHSDHSLHSRQDNSVYRLAFG